MNDTSIWPEWWCGTFESRMKEAGVLIRERKPTETQVQYQLQLDDKEADVHAVFIFNISYSYMTGHYGEIAERYILIKLREGLALAKEAKAGEGLAEGSPAPKSVWSLT